MGCFGCRSSSYTSKLLQIFDRVRNKSFGERARKYQGKGREEEKGV
jgi:hypothetical protein